MSSVRGLKTSPSWPSLLTMRRPIRHQLLLPMLVVVLAGVAVASLTGAWMGAHFARQQEQENLRRLARTLADTGFPLSENVLRTMAGLSGAEFVVLSDTGEVQQSTIALSGEESAELIRLVQFRSDPDSPTGLMLKQGTRRYTAARLPVLNQPPRTDRASLYVLYPEEHWDRLAWRAAWPPLVAGLVAGGVALTLTTLVARRFTARVSQLSEQAAVIAAGQFLTRPLPRTNDELQELARALNRMAEQLGHYEEQVRRSERLRTLGQLGAGIAHQLRNAATGALMALELHAAELDAAADRESLDVAIRQLRLMESSLKRFLQLGRSEPATLQTLSLGHLVEEILPLIEPACRHAKIRLTWQHPSIDDRVLAEPDSLRQLLLNLLVNAIEAATKTGGADGLVRVEIDRTGTGQTDRVRLSVLDDGPGPGPEIRDRIFEPFATSKPDGTGLGLFVARQIADAHEANLQWSRTEGLTRFEVRLRPGTPAVRDEAAPGLTVEPSPA